MKNKGSILIMALFIVVLIASISTVIMSRLSHTLSRTKQLWTLEQSALMVGGIIDWAMTSLVLNAAHPVENAPLDKMPMIYPATDAQVKLEGSVEDAEGRLNVNNLSEYIYIDQLVRLLAIVAPDARNAEVLAHEIAAWVTEYSMGSSEWDEKYRQVLYYPPHHAITDIHTLRYVLGMTPEIFNALAPYIVALPMVRTPINVNTASAPVLRMLVRGLTQREAEQLILDRNEKPFLTPGDFVQHPLVKNHAFADAPFITVVSDYFLVNTRVTAQHSVLETQALLVRDNQGENSQVKVLWQNQH